MDLYKNDFEIFLDHTNEKRILLDYISKEIKENQANSLLDIGAGNGLLSIPLAKKVNKYLAIEPKSSFASILEQAKLTVIKKPFPFYVNEYFDIVLSCHSIPHNIDSATSFIKEAWDSVALGGKLIVITYRSDKENSWTKLMNTLGENWLDTNVKSYQALIALLYSFSDKLEVEEKTSSVMSLSLPIMIKVLSFVYSDGEQEAKDRFFKKEGKVEEVLRSKYCYNDIYSFIFSHFCIKVQK